MNRTHFKISCQKGDTLVEVMISVAVTALIMTAAFLVASQSTKSTQQAQERGEALNIAQGQLESLTTYLSAASIPATPTPFCIDNAAVPPQLVLVTAGADICNRPNPGSLYRVAIVPTAGVANTYDITITWPSIKGNGNDSLILTSRSYAN